MRHALGLTFKVASEDWEFEQIHRLNYQTFVGEIPQHETNREQKLVDRFHRENTYVICLSENKVVGMVAVRGKRPFSLDQKLGNIDACLPPGRSVCELRLLSVEKSHRSGPVLPGLLKSMVDHCLGAGYKLAVISGLIERQKLYEGLGFVSFGPLIGTEHAKFQPMYLTLEALEKRGAPRIAAICQRPVANVNLLPGPVTICSEVQAAFGQGPVSHRSDSFMRDLDQTKELLCDLVGARHVEILMGSGTLANDAVAGQLSLHSGCGLILSNGEFGERLIDHGKRFSLSFETLRAGWGYPFDPADVERAVKQVRETAWLWIVHCETSTGVLNDLAVVENLCAEKHIKLCVDCISSIGTVPIDLSDVYLASGVSGKGLGAYSGLAMVFHNHDIFPAPDALPRYLDLGLYAADDAVPFTFSSNLVHALQASLKAPQRNDLYNRLSDLSRWVRLHLRDVGFKTVASDEQAAPAVVTIALPDAVGSEILGCQLERLGYLLSYKSKYLLERNWIQICLMGNGTQGEIEAALDQLEKTYIQLLGKQER